MRKIEFKGKQIENGEWVYGFVAQAIPETLETYIMPQEIYNAYEFKSNEEITLVFEKFFEVDPKTVGQYTGMKDKNGIKYYEGDKIKRTIKGFDSKIAICDFGYVVFKDGEWRIQFTHEENVGLNRVSEKTHQVSLWLFSDSFEVIGNIHD